LEAPTSIFIAAGRNNLSQRPIKIKEKPSMQILFLTSAHNSLSQRLLIELTERGHEVRASRPGPAEREGPPWVIRVGSVNSAIRPVSE
jgi:hypothetical protein